MALEQIWPERVNTRQRIASTVSQSSSCRFRLEFETVSFHFKARPINFGQMLITSYAFGTIFGKEFSCNR